MARDKKYTVCPKVAYNSFHMVFSAISGWILKPFDLQVATMCGFDIMYDKSVLPSKVPPYLHSDMIWRKSYFWKI